MNEKLLLINDMPGYGKVALAAMIPVLSHMGYNLYTLPTALVSNTLDYGKFEILDATQYMKHTLAVWKELGFSFDCISTGFITSEEQAALIASYCSEQKQRGTRVFVDPIMGDNGKLYNGVSKQTVAHMRHLCQVADVMMPNFTEATFLADQFCGATDLTAGQAGQLLHTLRTLCTGSIVITSASVEGVAQVLCWNAEHQTQFSLPFEPVPVQFPGTGDLFSAVLVGKMMAGEPLEQSTQMAMDAVRDLILKNRDNQDKYKGIPLEQFLEELP